MRFDIGETVEVGSPTVCPIHQCVYRPHTAVSLYFGLQVQGDAREGFSGAWSVARIIAKNVGFVTVIYDQVWLLTGATAG